MPATPASHRRCHVIMRVLRPQIICVLIGVVFAAGAVSAQTTLYWSGAALDPAVGGDGGWHDALRWSTQSTAYVGSTWSNGTSSAVLGGSASGVISVTGMGASGQVLTLQRDYTINTNGYSVSFGSLVFSGAATNLTITGGGTFGSALAGGTVTLSGAGTTFSVNGPSVVSAGIKGGDGTTIQFLGSGPVDNVAVELAGSATLRSVGRSVTLGALRSAAEGAGIVENGHGLREATVTIAPAAGTETYSGLIRDSAAGPQQYARLRLHKSGAGTVVLAGAPKTHSGGTGISGGILRMGAPNILPPAGSVMIGQDAAGVLDLNGYDQTVGLLSSGPMNYPGSRILLGTATLTIAGGWPFTDYRGTIEGSGSLIKTGSAYQKLSGNNTHTGGTTVYGLLAVGSAGALGGGPVIAKDGSTLLFGTTAPVAQDINFESGIVTLGGDNVSEFRLDGVLSGAARLHFTGSAILTGANTYSGGTSVTNATLTLKADAVLGHPEGELVLTNAGLKWADTFSLHSARPITVSGSVLLQAQGYTVTLANNIAGTGSVTVDGGAVVVSGQNTHAGGLHVTSGSLTVSGPTTLGAESAPLSVGGSSRLRFQQSLDLSATRPVRVSGTQPGIDVTSGATVIVRSGLSDAGSFGNATFVKEGGGVLEITATSTMNAATTVSSGTLRLTGGTNRLPANKPVTVQGTLELAGSSQTVSALSGFGTVALTEGTLRVTSSSTFDGKLSGTGLVRTLGGGTFTPGDSPDFAGRWELTGGALRLFQPLGASSTVALSGGATISGTSTAGHLEVGAGGVLAPGNAIGRLTVASADFQAGSRYQWQIYSATSPASSARDRLVVQGAVAITSGPSDPLVIRVVSMANLSTPGPVYDFDPAQDFRHKLITSGSGIIGFSPDKIALDLSGFSHAYPGEFRVELSADGRDLELVYDAITFDTWSLAHFTEAELLDPAVSGPNADPDGDGFANLLEFALGLDPRAATTAGLPAISIGTSELIYTYRRPASRSELTYVVQVSTDLSTWTTAGVTHELLSTADGVETWRGRVPTALGPNLFLRLRVSR